MNHYTEDDIRYLESMYEKEYYANLCDTTAIGMAYGNVMKHQMIQMNFAINFSKRFEGEILTETSLSDEIRITPDISIWRYYDFERGEAEDPILTIEITHTRRNDRYSDKTLRATLDFFPTIVESFIYNYADDTWYRYFRGDDGEVYVQDDCDFSTVLRCPLHTLLQRHDNNANRR